MLSVKPYTPSREDPAALDARTVGREELLSALDMRIRQAAASRNRGHTLLVGARGAGKSHVIEVALHRLAADAQLSARFAIVRVAEDIVAMNHVADIYALLAASEGVAKQDADLVAHARRARDVATLRKILDAAVGDRVLLVAIENLDRLFRRIGDAGQRELRGWFESSGNALLLGSTPLLSSDLTSRSKPWFGAFSIEFLEPLSVEQGRDLLLRTTNDGDLVEFLGTPTGLGRLKAVHGLAGGSPRIWLVLATCITVERLDELVDGVEALLEALVPYYQQQLWDLPPDQAAIVVALARGSARSTVNEIAASAGLDAKVTATLLRRLQDARWVRGTKQTGTDRRTTWYELREPLLRHHLQYRDGRGDQLRLIVDLLRAWFDPSERVHRLLAATPGSVDERYVAESLSGLGPFGIAMEGRDLKRLHATARRWAVGQDDDFATVEAGVSIEALCIAATQGPAAALQTMSQRNASREAHHLATLLMGVYEGAGQDLEESVVAALDAACKEASGATRIVLEMLRAEWADDSSSVARLAEMIERSEPMPARLHFAIRGQHAVTTFLAGRRAEAMTLFEVLISDMVRRRDVDDLETKSVMTLYVSVASVAGQELTAVAFLESLEANVRRTRLDIGATAALRLALLTSFVSIARRRVGAGPLTGYGSLPNDDVLVELRRAALDGDATAYARLPSEVRQLIESDEFPESFSGVA